MTGKAGRLSPKERRWRVGRVGWSATRPLKVYAFDPSRGHYLGNEMTLEVPYERLERGPAGGVVAVIDYDATNDCFYDPVDLEEKHVLLRGGLSPSETNPHFHQQMVYAVARDTVRQFEAALGRRIHWRLGEYRGAGKSVDNIDVLLLYPHAMMDKNAFYCPEAQGILFGYFRASETDPGRNLPGQTVFTCLSHDIIVHEVTHAVIDGIRQYFTEPSNDDVAAFHEAFADLVALFRHFSHKEVLLDAIQKTGGRLFDLYLAPAVHKSARSTQSRILPERAARNPLIELARQFGDATGRNAGLRAALDTAPDPKDYAEKTEPHSRGSILVSAVFDAYFTIYLQRTAELFRLYRAGGGGAGSDYDVPDPLARLLAAEASRTAQEFFRLCVRALDYCPPVDIRFGDFLRSIITIHSDLTPLDEDGIREAFMDAFRVRGILPEGATSFSEDALRWRRESEEGEHLFVEGLVFGDPNGLTRPEMDKNGELLRKYANRNAAALGFDPSYRIEAPSFHPTFRVGPDGRLRTDMVVEFVQERDVPFDRNAPGFGAFPFRGGATAIISKPLPNTRGKWARPRVRYLITKHMGKPGGAREERQRQFYLRNGFLEGDPHDKRRFQINFALLHGGI